MPEPLIYVAVCIGLQAVTALTTASVYYMVYTARAKLVAAAAGAPPGISIAVEDFGDRWRAQTAGKEVPGGQ
ncbi:hypothetical protein [Micromonospora aurantiaca (nom. illeg.)]|uniref:hypothetical protein n=1 Tax=Micromonospora aurantiaca (nom. illeg.) TaxID=47850 RepID=UPI0010758E8D